MSGTMDISLDFDIEFHPIHAYRLYQTTNCDVFIFYSVSKKNIEEIKIG